MKQHSASELRYRADILDTDGATVLVSQVGAGITDLSGRRLEQAQLISAQTSHMISLRYADGLALPPQGFLSVTDPGTEALSLYIVDYVQDPRIPRPRVWTEVYCHVEKAGADAD